MSSTDRQPPSKASSALIPTLGLFSAVMLVAGGVIGSGIFRKPGIMAAQVGSPGVLLGIWIAVGVVSLLGTLSNAELAGMMPETGGQYQYLRRAYHPFVAFLYGWSLLSVIQTGSIAALAYVFAEHASRIFPLPAGPDAWSQWIWHVPFLGEVAPAREFGVKVLASILILTLSFVNYLGVRFGGWIQNLFSVAKMTAMVGLVLAMIFTPGVAHWEHLTHSIKPIEWSSMAWWASVVAAMQGAFWAYDGWHKITYIGGELRNPQQNLPRSLTLGILLVTGLYCTMALAYSLALPIETMAQSKLVAADVADRCFRGGGQAIAIAVMLSTLGAANAVILTSARVYYSMGLQGQLPAFFGTTHRRFHTPALSLLFQALWSVVLLWSGTFDTLTDTLIFISWFFYIANALAVLRLRRREPNTPRPFRVPGYPWVPLIFATFGAVYLTLTLLNDFEAYRLAKASGQPALLHCALGFVLVLVGTPFYFLGRSSSPTAASR